MTSRKEASNLRSLIWSRTNAPELSQTTRTPPRTNAYWQWDHTFVYHIFLDPSLINLCPTWTYELTIGNRAFTGLGDGVNHCIRDLRTVRETELERPAEHSEKTNRKSHQLFPVTEHLTVIMSVLLPRPDCHPRQSGPPPPLRYTTDDAFSNWYTKLLWHQNMKLIGQSSNKADTADREIAAEKW